MNQENEPLTLSQLFYTNITPKKPKGTKPQYIKTTKADREDFRIFANKPETLLKLAEVRKPLRRTYLQELYNRETGRHVSKYWLYHFDKVISN